jgi:hypothetical protein
VHLPDPKKILCQIRAILRSHFTTGKSCKKCHFLSVFHEFLLAGGE